METGVSWVATRVSSNAVSDPQRGVYAISRERAPDVRRTGVPKGNQIHLEWDGRSRQQIATTGSELHRRLVRTAELRRVATVEVNVCRVLPFLSTCFLPLAR